MNIGCWARLGAIVEEEGYCMYTLPIVSPKAPGWLLLETRCGSKMALQSDLAGLLWSSKARQ